MANILVVTTPSPGHINPFLPLIKQLTANGHNVCWYTGEVFRTGIEDVGAQFAPIKQAVDHGGVPKTEAFPNLQDLTGLQDFVQSWKTIFLDNAPLQMQDLLDVLEDFPADVVLSDETTFSAGFVCEKTGLPHVVVSTSVYFYRSHDTAPLGLGMLPDASLLGRLRNGVLAFVADRIRLRELVAHGTKTRQAVELEPLPGGVLQNVNRKPDMYLLATVPSFEYPMHDMLPNTHFIGSLNVPFQHDDFSAPDWWPRLQTEQPVIHITQGTVNNNNADQLLRPALEALQDENMLVVVTTGGLPPAALNLPNNRSNVIIEPFVPHHQLLPRVDVMVTNGGYGGVQRALLYGVPLVISGATEEKPDVAARVEWAGMGINLRQIQPDPVTLRNAVQRVLTESRFAEKARALQAEFATYNAPHRATTLLEQFLAERDTPPSK
jgi:MGT family glycosyltransferase